MSDNPERKLLWSSAIFVSKAKTSLNALSNSPRRPVPDQPAIIQRHPLSCRVPPRRFVFVEAGKNRTTGPRQFEQPMRRTFFSFRSDRRFRITGSASGGPGCAIATRQQQASCEERPHAMGLFLLLWNRFAAGSSLLRLTRHRHAFQAVRYFILFLLGQSSAAARRSVDSKIIPICSREK